MLTIDTVVNAPACTMTLAGRLDTESSRQLADRAMMLDRSVDTLTLDLSGLEYISSGGLRTLLILKKHFDLSITGVSEEVREILEVTGFIGFLTIK